MESNKSSSVMTENDTSSTGSSDSTQLPTTTTANDKTTCNTPTTCPLRPELQRKIQAWLISFHRLDPRYKLLNFFNRVASEGADNLVNDNESDDGFYELTAAQQLIKESFNTTSILTVWRPCSNDAMRRMMEGEGVGKGLDIKGKSAKKGLLSALVPFMQIHNEADKSKIQPISVTARMRVYYSSKESREQAIKALGPLAVDYAESDNDRIPSTMHFLNDYTYKGFYGLEVSQRLFWAGYVLCQNIQRQDGTATGRPSTPGFQDANLKTLKVACASLPSPLPVVFQYDKEQAMRPQTLVMAYEENGTVTPVVSDFDGFLLGWRREALWFGCNLPRDQEDLMMWCIEHIATILDEPPTTDTWTVRWLDILKKEAKEGFIPDIPEYGFGDPKSYSIMEEAARRLIDTGAVRHGSECFNYYFPQEIDDKFLLISDTLSPVPWKYVGVQELQQILSEKIAEGFVFPLNPKWILCDPGWKKLYDELMASEALYADLSKDVWYPRWSGVREKIDLIHRRHPNGFQRRHGRVSFVAKKGYSPLRQNLEQGMALSGKAAFALAQIELENYTSRKHRLANQIRLACLANVPDDGDDDHKDAVRMAKRQSMRVEERRKLFASLREEAMPPPTNESDGCSDGSDGSSNGSGLLPRGKNAVSTDNELGGKARERSLSPRSMFLSPRTMSRRRMFSHSRQSNDLQPRRNFTEYMGDMQLDTESGEE